MGFLYLKNLAKKAPGPLMRGAFFLYRLIPENWRYGGEFRQAVALLRDSEDWNRKELDEYRRNRLQVLLSHAYANVPYYRKVFDVRSLKPRDIQSPEDLKKLPFLTKEIVRKERENLLATNIPFWKREPAHTSGSTGSPLDFYVDNSTIAMNKALALRHLAWVGRKKTDSVAVFKEPLLVDQAGFKSYDPMARELRLTLTKSDDTELQRIVETLESFKPDFISAWPSSLFIVARWIERNRPLRYRPRFIITSSENLYPHMRRQIETTFSAPLSDWYGQEESVAVAMQCAHSEKYHLQEELGILELSPTKEGHKEIVGTCLHNFAMPFIRYKTGDLALQGNEPCPCGRIHPTLDGIIGREADLIITPEKNVVSPLGLNYAFYYLDEIKEGQIIQQDLKTLLVKVLPWESLSETTVKKLQEQLAKYVESTRMEFIIEPVEEIPRLESGKRPFVISHVDPQELN